MSDNSNDITIIPPFRILGDVKLPVISKEQQEDYLQNVGNRFIIAAIQRIYPNLIVTINSFGNIDIGGVEFSTKFNLCEKPCLCGRNLFGGCVEDDFESCPPGEERVGCNCVSIIINIELCFQLFQRTHTRYYDRSKSIVSSFTTTWKKFDNFGFTIPVKRFQANLPASEINNFLRRVLDGLEPSLNSRGQHYGSPLSQPSIGNFDLPITFEYLDQPILGSLTAIYGGQSGIRGNSPQPGFRTGESFWLLSVEDQLILPCGVNPPENEPTIFPPRCNRRTVDAENQRLLANYVSAVASILIYNAGLQALYVVQLRRALEYQERIGFNCNIETIGGIDNPFFVQLCVEPESPEFLPLPPYPTFSSCS